MDSGTTVAAPMSSAPTTVEIDARISFLLFDIDATQMVLIPAGHGGNFRDSAILRNFFQVIFRLPFGLRTP
jgi:hypothetical protein